jgi:hypothetical protein
MGLVRSRWHRAPRPGAEGREGPPQLTVGVEIDRARFTARDFARFKARLPEQLTALERVLARPGFGQGARSIGVELELFLVDAGMRPRPVALEVLPRVPSRRVSAELDRWEIELGSHPVALAGRPFQSLEGDLAAEWALVDAAAGGKGARTVAVGILPTLQRSDLNPRAITNLPRYQALTAGLRQKRRAPFRICIDGDDPLDLTTDDASMEGANTAFQVHLRAEPGEFARLFNAAQLAAAAALAASGNSPTFLGHRLWEETRVALFKQAGDLRPPDRDQDWRTPARISFGNGWMREGAVEQFRESVALHEPLLPVVGKEDALAVVEAGGIPELGELRLHHGTVWYWNRAVFDPSGHLRLELRALPAGPTLADMLANAAFLVGLTLDLAPEIDSLLPGFPFSYAERNFYRAAQQGLAAELLWPTAEDAPRPTPARELLPRLIERARRGLAVAGVDAADIDERLGVFAARVDSGLTGAAWQRRALAAAEQALGDRPRALASMLERYVGQAGGGRPVHDWVLP